jgi:phage terminase large subunit
VHGGRGSGKSCTIAKALLLISFFRKKSLIVCGREYQRTIKDSVHSLFKQTIDAFKLNEYFDISYDEIRNLYSSSRFIFKGLKLNIDNIKSTPGITHFWIEEASTLTASSWRIIKPTVRENNSEIWATFNAHKKTDILYESFLNHANTIDPDIAYVTKVNFYDNPYFPEVLELERQEDKKRDLGLYKHIWDGECLEHSESQVFKNKWIVQNFEISDIAYKYVGLDFGFSQDPTAAVMCYIVDNILYIAYEAVGIGIEIDKIVDFMDYKLPRLKECVIYADSSRPEGISLIQRQGYQIYAAPKGKGSIEDGIEYIKSFEKIIIHPSCKHTANEFNLYSYKVEERSGDITTEIIDKNNHCIDAIRYGLSRCMQTAKTKKSTARQGFNKASIF